MKKPKKVKKRRDRDQHPALLKKNIPRVRQEYLDYDYLDQLNEKEKDWLNKFTEEYLNDSFKHDETDIQSYEKYGKDCNDMNNARNRCLYGALKNKANKFNNKKLVNYDNILTDIEEEMGKEIDPMRLEDAYVEYLEFKQIESFLEEYDQAMATFREPE